MRQHDDAPFWVSFQLTLESKLEQTNKNTNIDTNTNTNTQIMNSCRHTVDECTPFLVSILAHTGVKIGTNR